MKRHTDHRSLWRLALALSGLLAAGWATPADAQDDNSRLASRDRERAAVSKAFAEGDFASASRLLGRLGQQSSALSDTADGPDGDKAQAALEVEGLDGSTFFEELGACGFYPQETRLECVVDVKRPFGYGGNVGQFGSFEFVQFCVDWNCDDRFSANEFVGFGIVHVHDDTQNPALLPRRPPWSYAVYRDIDPPGQAGRCTVRTSNAVPTETETYGQSRRARAILSWGTPAQGCNSRPFWGNAVDFEIRLDPIR